MYRRNYWTTKAIALVLCIAMVVISTPIRSYAVEGAEEPYDVQAILDTLPVESERFTRGNLQGCRGTD